MSSSLPVLGLCVVAAAVLFGLCGGVTLFVSSKYPLPAPFVTSLYRALQTYDRGKPPRAQRPLIVISKVRPCYGSESARHFGLVKPTSPHQLTTARSVSTYSEDIRLLPTPNKEFPGNWQIVQPVLKEDLDDQVIKYNKDCTRIVHETLYHFHTRDPQIAMKGVPEKGLNIHHTKPATTALQSTAGVTKASASLPKITLTAQYHISLASTPEASSSTISYISSTAAPATTPKSTIINASAAATEVKYAQTQGPIAVGSSYFVHDSFKTSKETKAPSSTQGMPVTSSTAPMSVSSYVVQETPTSTQPPKKSLISKLGGGAQSIFNHIFGGLLNGRHTKDQNGDALSPSANESLIQSTDELPGNFSDHITKGLPASFWSQLQFLQEQLEKNKRKRNTSKPVTTTTIKATTSLTSLPVPTLLTTSLSSSTTGEESPVFPYLSQDEDFASSTSAYVFHSSSTLDTWSLEQSTQKGLQQELEVPTEEADYPDFTPWITSEELATDMPYGPDSISTLSPMFYGKINSPSSEPANEEYQNGNLATSTSRWRPLRRPVPYLPNPTRGPAPAPLGIHQWLHDTRSDTSDWWDTEPQSTTEKPVKRWFQKVAATGPVPRLPFDVTTYRPLKGLSPIQWLFGNHFQEARNSTNATATPDDSQDMSQEPDIETRAKEGMEVLDVPTSRIKPPPPDMKPSDALAGRESSSAQLLKHAQVVNQSSSNMSQVSGTRFKGNHPEIRAATEKQVAGERPIPATNASQIINSAEVIKEIGKFYTKLKAGLGLPLPLGIIEPFLTLKYETLKAKDRHE